MTGIVAGHRDPMKNEVIVLLHRVGGRGSGPETLPAAANSDSSKRIPSLSPSVSYNEAANDIVFDQTRDQSQTITLSTKRAISSIPNSDFTPAHQPQNVDKWVYPSGEFVFDVFDAFN